MIICSPFARGKSRASGPAFSNRRDQRSGLDVSYIEKLDLGFDPDAATLQFEIELQNRHLAMLMNQYDAALRDVKADRKGPNPAAIRAEITSIIQSKTKLVQAHTNRIKLAKDYMTKDQAVVFVHLVFWLVSRLGLTDAQREQFRTEGMVCFDAPHRLSELKPPAGQDRRDFDTRAKAVFTELMAERQGLKARTQDDETDENVEDTEEVEEA